MGRWGKGIRDITHRGERLENPCDGSLGVWEAPGALGPVYTQTTFQRCYTPARPEGVPCGAQRGIYPRIGSVNSLGLYDANGKTWGTPSNLDSRQVI